MGNLAFPHEHTVTGTHQFRSDPDFNGYFAKDLGGVKDSAGNKAVTVIKSGDNIKTELEAAPNGSWVIILSGEYYTSTAIDLSAKKNLRITGMGWEKGTDYKPTIIYTDQNIYLFDLGYNTGSTNIIIENLRLEQRAASRTGRGIYFANQQSSAYRFSDLYIDFFYYGMYANGNTGGAFKNLRFNDCYRAMVLTNTHSCLVSDCVFTSCSNMGLLLYAIGSSEITDCVFRDTPYAIYFSALAWGFTAPALITNHSIYDCNVGLGFSATASSTTYPRTVLVSNIGFYGDGDVAVRFDGDYGYAPVAFTGLYLSGSFSYGFYENGAKSEAYDIPLLTNVVATNATFSTAAVSLPNANIIEQGHNPGLT